MHEWEFVGTKLKMFVKADGNGHNLGHVPIEWCRNCGALRVDRNRIVNPDKKWIVDDDAKLQVGILKFKKGHYVKKHRHNHIDEFLLVRSGDMKYKAFYKHDQDACTTKFRGEGGFIYISVGVIHSVEFMEDTELLVVKNGPYKCDKELLE